MEQVALMKYTIGLVVNAPGLNDAQLAEIKSRLSFIAKALNTERPVILVVMGFDPAGSPEALPASVRNLQYAGGVKTVSVLPVRSGQWGMAYHEIKHCDEIWCCPAAGQDYRLSRTRAMQVYTLGQSQHQPARFKLIPAWVSVPEAPTKKAKKSKRPQQPFQRRARYA